MRRILFILGLLVALAGCGGDRVAGGGGFGGETISGRVIDRSGRGVAGATLRARLSHSLDGQILRESAADDSGYYVLANLPSVPLRIEVAGKSGTDSVKSLVDRDPGKPLGDIPALAVADRRIRIVDGLGAGLAATLQVYGVGLVASTDDSGVVRLAGWPVSDLWVKVSPRDGSRPLDLLVPAKANGDIVATTGWLVDDFEGRESRTRLGLLIGGGWWYAVGAGVATHPEESNFTSQVFSSGYDTTACHGGEASLHVKYLFDPNSTQRYGLVGFHLGSVDGASIDLSGMDSLVLWAKGTGSVRIDLIGMEGGVKRVFAKSTTPGMDWTRIALVPTDFVDVEGESTWTKASRQALYLQFSVYSNTEFWLDDIRIFSKSVL
ncbi:MAG: lipoprotein [Fibrobacterota bacterium]